MPHLCHVNQTRQQVEPIKPNLKLSALWLFILLNVIFRDIHQFTMKAHLEMLLTGYYNGMEITDSLMLLGGFLVEVPIAMFLLSLLLRRRYNRPLNIVAVVITAGVFLTERPSDPDDVFFKIIEFIALGAIVWTAIRWKAGAQQPA